MDYCLVLSCIYQEIYQSTNGGALVLLKSVYGITNSGKLFSDELTQWLHEAGLFNLNFRYLSIISMHKMEKNIYLMLIIVSIGIVMKLLEIVCGYFREDIPCELLGICTLVNVNMSFSNEGSFHFFKSG